MSNLCICNSGKLFALCCEPFLSGKEHAKTPVKLMRSRFSAFALGDFGQYLLETWSVSQRAGLSPDELSLRSIDWLSLEIVDKSQRGDHGMVEFKAYYRDGEGNQALHHERSDFERVGGRWFYVSGKIF